MLGIILSILGSIVGIWAFVKYILLIEMRIDANTFKTLYDIYKDDRKVLLQEEYISESRYPVVYNAFCFFHNSPWFYINHGERLMQTGWNSKEYVTVITCFRWKYKTLQTFLRKCLKELQLYKLGIPVSLMLPFYVDKIGTLKEAPREPLVNKRLYEDFEKEVAEVAAEKRAKTGALLYGPPGNGKTSLVKYLATKYRLPIMIITFSPDWSNHDLLLLFSQIPSRCIVLMEDFDNYFHGRKCIMGNENKFIKFTFDIILNGLDGVYNTYENVVFIMTVNDIEKVDYALRNRPSRFKYTKCFDNPDIYVRRKLLSEEWAALSDGLNLDQICRLKEYQSLGDTFQEAMEKLERNVEEQNIQELAFQRYQDRLKTGEPGTADDDYYYALHSCNGHH